MKEKTNEILDILNSTNTIKRLQELSIIINENDEYNDLMKEFLKNKTNYTDNNTFSKEILNLRKKLFDIPELKEYLSLQNELRILSININNIIMSVLN